jgi:ribose transport system ATP-binding protein
MLPGFSVRENLTLVDLQPYWARGRVDRGAERNDVLRWLTRLGIVPLDTERAIELLSGGNQQRVLVAKWLRTDPRVLIVDNPTQGVDVAAKESLYSLFTAAAAAGAAVVVCSTDADELARLCDRVLVLRDGVVAAELTGAAMEPEAIEREVLASHEQEALT